MNPPENDPLTRHWGLRAATTGTIACGLGALVCTWRYLLDPNALSLDWSRMPVAIALFVLVGGISIGLCVGGMTLLAARRGGRISSLVAGGALGGLLAGVAPGILGIAGFGSLDAPYAGTFNILSSCLLGAIAFVALWSAQIFPARGGSSLRHLAHATVASVVALGAAGMIGWGVMQTFGWVPTWPFIADVAHAVGLLPFAVIVGALMAAVGGAAIGGACGLVGLMRRA